MMGIRHVLLAVNKMDLVDYSQQVFDAIAAEYTDVRGRVRRDARVAADSDFGARRRPPDGAEPADALV